MSVKMSVKRLCAIAAALSLTVAAGGAFAQNILRAVLYGDGHGRPDSLRIYYADGGSNYTVSANELPLIEKVTLDWPMVGGTVITALPANITARGDLILSVNLAAVRDANVPTGYTSFANDGWQMVKVFGGSEGAGAVTEFFDVFDAIGPVLANDKDAGGNPRIIENRASGTDPDTLIIKLSEQPKVVTGADLVGSNTLFYTAEADPANNPATGGTALTVFDAWPEDAATNAYTVVVAPVAGGLREGNWIRLNPAGPLVDRAERMWEVTHPANKAHPNNRWVQLKEIEVPPAIKEAWYTSNPSTGKVDYTYIEFDKVVHISSWFLGGYIYFTGGDLYNDSTVVTATNISSLFSVDPGNPKVLKVDLSVAYKSSQSAIRTSGVMNFRIGWANWKTGLSGSAADRAKPVLSDAVILKVGSLQEDGTPNPDTLIVTYSEPIDVALTEAGKQSQPVTLLVGNNGNMVCKPVLGSPQVTNLSNGYSRVTYVVDGNLCAGSLFPTPGDYVRINVGGSVGDRVDPPNVQDVPDNLKVLITDKLISVASPAREIPPVKPAEEFVAVTPVSRSATGLTVGPSPLGKNSGAVNFFRIGSRLMPSTLYVYDASGNVVRKIVVSDNAVGAGISGRRVVGSWDLTDAKGRTVPEGAYLVRGVVKTADGKSDKVSLVVGAR